MSTPDRFYEEVKVYAKKLEMMLENGDLPEHKEAMRKEYEALCERLPLNLEAKKILDDYVPVFDDTPTPRPSNR